MRYEDAGARISKTSTGVYIAYPTSVELKPIYRGYKTIVNSEHTKVGIAQRSFESREHGYVAVFQSEVKFFPILELPATQLPEFKAQLIAHLRSKYSRSGPAREWFHTTERQAIAELVWSLSKAGA
jgi:hypothetical protein